MTGRRLLWANVLAPLVGLLAGRALTRHAAARHECILRHPSARHR